MPLPQEAGTLGIETMVGIRTCGPGNVDMRSKWSAARRCHGPGKPNACPLSLQRLFLSNSALYQEYRGTTYTSCAKSLEFQSMPKSKFSPDRWPRETCPPQLRSCKSSTSNNAEAGPFWVSAPRFGRKLPSSPEAWQLNRESERYAPGHRRQSANIALFGWNELSCFQEASLALRARSRLPGTKKTRRNFERMTCRESAGACKAERLCDKIALRPRMMLCIVSA